MLIVTESLVQLECFVLIAKLATGMSYIHCVDGGASDKRSSAENVMSNDCQ
jgi:hypothetical protein